jgi:hypothetical protein
MNLLIEVTYLITWGVKMKSINKKQDLVKNVDCESFISLHDLVTLTTSLLVIIGVVSIIYFGSISLLMS